MNGPLSGFRIIELAGIGPGPYAGQIFADMGADVICVEKPGSSLIAGIGTQSVDRRGKKSIVIDLRKPEGAKVLLKLVESADAIFEGNRPGVAERLGVGPDDCFKVNPKLVYGRMTGWGQIGPWANMAGHDINYISITGALQAMGYSDRPPAPPINFLGDYGGGTMNLVTGILAAMLRAQKSGKGEVVDAAIIDGVSSMMGIVYSMDSQNLWRTDRQSNLLDGGTPFYRCYRTKDERFIAVGCLEPQFYAIMITLLGIDVDDFGNQYDFSKWPSQHEKLEKIFLSKTQETWSEIFDGTDACITPVLDYKEAQRHKQMIARGGLKEHEGMVHPRTIPAFESRPDEPEFEIVKKATHTIEIMEAAGFSRNEIDALLASNTVTKLEP